MRTTSVTPLPTYKRGAIAGLNALRSRCAAEVLSEGGLGDRWIVGLAGLVVVNLGVGRR